ncbi:hypothetical protein E1A91_D13G240800v1 [Gossypium mustelinum]|uniref:Uncharacterized protein n=1 Tax=Gossypium mustelinum TaxID=34275 RepID=A0A5D2S5X0_GOSMU|nr:hypothetical protein E1A91_D13G240800v1 [Gossypium mustelinum]TYI48332.1 hypothetical protein E1A91_D13G240800v1 [Gossypium mustelinum]
MEWRDKILIVIVKAEEIMYSKANSENEYMNPETLWDRVNDAIDTIIRRDESTETGELLPPCVEAALNLGCYPVRYSRSQQHCNPRTYLTPRAPEHVSLAPRIFDEGSEESCPWLPPVQSVRIATDVNSNISVSQAYHRWSHFLSEDCPYDCDQSTRIETKTSPIGQVYPLYHGIHHQNTQPLTGSPVCENIMSDTIFVRSPIGTSLAELGVNGSSLNLFSSSDIGGKGDGLQDMKRTNEKSFLAECDLSLRLGLFSDPRVQVEKDSIVETGDVGQSSPCDGGKVNEVFQQKSKEFCFSLEGTVNGHFEPIS